jgi:hypothetical protein
MKYILPLLFLASCSKAEIAPAPAVNTNYGAIERVAPVKDTAVYLSGYNTGIGDSLKSKLAVMGVSVYDQTEANPNLDYLTHTVPQAPDKAVMFFEALSADVYQNRTTDDDYINRVRAYKNSLEARGWQVVVVLPAGMPSFGLSNSGFTYSQYQAVLQRLAAALQALPEFNTVQGTTAAITVKIASL